MLFIKRTIAREDSIGMAEWEYAGEWMRELGSPLPRVFAATKWREAGERLQQHLDELLEHWDRCLATEFTPWQLKIFTLETLLACQISEKEAFSNPKRVWIISNSLSLKLSYYSNPRWCTLAGWMQRFLCHTFFPENIWHKILGLLVM